MTEIQGHRGCRGLLPENSIIGFEKAIDLGVHTLEMDIAVSKDQKVVVSHEPFMNHEIVLDLQGNSISKKDEEKYNLYQMNYDSIRQYDCGSKKNSKFPLQKNIKVVKPLLSEVIAMAEARSNKQIKYNIEFKSEPAYDGIYTPNVSQFVRLVVEVLKDNELGMRVNLQAFDIRILEEIKKQAPKIRIALLVNKHETIAEKLQQLSFKPQIISPYYKLLNEENTKEYQECGFRIIPWTVNSEKEMQYLLDIGVDAIVTDYPNMLKSLCI
ncbi:Glycerophosphoryl diester phosphodiesterase [Kordia antarctica]|uniref:Glycerophosphoryl diester phosphodiesterase n=1 Tax=Kordia antarctica TaxID=1218801 RepID=A0A7L4ZKI9_9FLAO|nr:glycerophosphodiester phosphodiesterase family protein [Kordia antarctica]QHI36444.1 Glycerophosphoryl diester phosphodiesterase [Kordia antarctica]